MCVSGNVLCSAQQCLFGHEQASAISQLLYSFSGKKNCKVSADQMHKKAHFARAGGPSSGCECLRCSSLSSRMCSHARASWQPPAEAGPWLPSLPPISVLEFSWGGGGEISLAVQSAGSADRSELKITQGKKKKAERKYGIFQPGSLCITDGCSGAEAEDGSPEGLSPMVRVLFRRTRKSKGRAGSSLHPHCHSSTWKIPILSQGSRKKELCENGKGGSVSTKQTEIMSQATEVIPLSLKKKKQHYFYFLSAVLDFNIIY